MAIFVLAHLPDFWDLENPPKKFKNGQNFETSQKIIPTTLKRW